MASIILNSWHGSERITLSDRLGNEDDFPGRSRLENFDVRARGFGKARIIWREAFRNALVPTVTLSGVQFTFLLGGTVLVERIFSYPGLGNMAIGAVIDRDLPLIQGVVLIFAVLFIAINLLVDMTYALLNPRIRHG